MAQIAEKFEILSEEEQVEMYEKAKKDLDERQAAWIREQESFLDENPDYRDDPELNAAFVSEVNRLIATETTEKGMKMTDRQVLESAFVRVYLKGGQ